MLNDPRKLRMDRPNLRGFYVYERKTQSASPVLKELLQLSKTVAQGKIQGFSFVHGHGSLIPNLTLWENLQLSATHELWDDFVKDSHPVIQALIPLLKEPYKRASVSTPWECFLVSLMKGILEPTPNLLVEMQEEMFPAFVVKTIKSTLMKSSVDKTVYLSSSSPSLWLDCAHHLVTRDGYKFHFEEMDEASIRKTWAA